MKAFVLGLGLATVAGGLAVAYAVQGDPPGMTCREVTVVRYYPIKDTSPPVPSGAGRRLIPYGKLA